MRLVKFIGIGGTVYYINPDKVEYVTAADGSGDGAYIYTQEQCFLVEGDAQVVAEKLED